MNKKQALRMATKNIEKLEKEKEDLEYANRLYAADVKAYNAVIDAIIKGESPCEWCEDYTECQKEKVGCGEWMLKFNDPATITATVVEEEVPIKLTGITPEPVNGGDSDAG